MGKFSGVLTGLINKVRQRLVGVLGEERAPNTPKTPSSLPGSFLYGNSGSVTKISGSENALRCSTAKQ